MRIPTRRRQVLKQVPSRPSKPLARTGIRLLRMTAFQGDSSAFIGLSVIRGDILVRTNGC